MSRKISLALIALICLAWPQFAGAQDIGSVRISTVYANPFGATPTACTGIPQKAQVPNNGQTGHYISYTTTNQPGFFTVSMNGQFSAAGASFAISDQATNPDGGELQANGNYPIMSITVVCGTPGSFTLSYTGQGVPTAPASGVNLQSQVIKRVLNQQSVNVAGSQSLLTTTPFGSSSGQIVLDASSVSAWPGSPTVTVTCNDVSSPDNSYATYVFPIPTNNVITTYPVPAVPCVQTIVGFTSTGVGGVGFFNLNYHFFPPGYSAPAFRFLHVTGTTATSVVGPTFLHSLSINTGAAGTISLFDLPSASCTGTPSTSPVAVVTATTSSLLSLLYDVNVTQGICVKASAAMDFTISYQ